MTTLILISLIKIVLSIISKHDTNQLTFIANISFHDLQLINSEPPPTTTPAEEETSEGSANGNLPAASGSQQEGGQGGQQARPSQAFPTPFKPPAQATRVVG